MDRKGFFAALFDFSFSEFITTKIIKILYGIALVVSAIAILIGVIGGFTRSVGTGILYLILSPIAFVLAAIMSRVYMELLIVIFRIAENTGDIAKMSKL